MNTPKILMEICKNYILESTDSNGRFIGDINYIIAYRELQKDEERER